jgi:AcrR family transcriptional regulator
VAKQTRSENTRLHLVRSAAELFDRNGFSGATLEDVSRSAGVTKGAFYFHFSSKDELAGAIQAEACALLRSAVHQVAGSGVSALQSVVDLTHELARWLEDEPLVRASFRTARECGHRGKPFLDFHTDLRAAVETLLRGADEAGELRAGLPVADAATLVLALCSGLEMLWWSELRSGAIAPSLAGIWRITLPGLAMPAVSRSVIAAGS